MDIALGVAIGSSTQISLLVVPVTVLLGWTMGQPLDLNLQMFETATLFTTVITVAVVSQDGKSNWLKGLTLVLAYILLSASFFFHADAQLAKETGHSLAADQLEGTAPTAAPTPAAAGAPP